MASWAGRNVYNASKSGDVRALRKLLAQDPSALDYRDKLNSSTCLHWAAERGHLECLKVLLEHGADIEVKNKQDFTPLHYTAWFGQLNCMLFLLAHGAVVNPLGEKKMTPLHLSAYSGRTGCVRVLLDHGADVGPGGWDGRTPYDLAIAQDLAVRITCPVLLAYGYVHPRMDQTWRMLANSALDVLTERRAGLGCASVGAVTSALDAVLSSAAGPNGSAPHSRLRMVRDPKGIARIWWAVLHGDGDRRSGNSARGSRVGPSPPPRAVLHLAFARVTLSCVAAACDAAAACAVAACRDAEVAPGRRRLRSGCSKLKQCAAVLCVGRWGRLMEAAKEAEREERDAATALAALIKSLDEVENRLRRKQEEPLPVIDVIDAQQLE